METEPRALLEILLSGRPWTTAEAEAFLTEVVSGEVPPEVLACALGALRARGETAEELLGFVRASRAAAREVRCGVPVYDLVGTGGDRGGTFNISTVAAFVASAAGVPVAKHGNRAVSSRCGSADLLEALGVPIDVEPAEVGVQVAEHGFAFLFAPHFHPGFRHAVGVRRALGVRTVFNLLGPLVNPARPRGSVVGVYAAEVGRLVAEALLADGVERALVVHGDGLDELTTTGPNRVWEIRDGEIAERTILAEEVGLPPGSLEDLQGGDPETNAAMARRILRGRDAGPREDIVCLSAGALVWVAGRADDLASGVEAAQAAISSGAAAARLEVLAARR